MATAKAYCNSCKMESRTKHCPSPNCSWYYCKDCELVFNPKNKNQTFPQTRERHNADREKLDE